MGMFSSKINHCSFDINLSSDDHRGTSVEPWSYFLLDIKVQITIPDGINMAITRSYPRPVSLKFYMLLLRPNTESLEMSEIHGVTRHVRSLQLSSVSVKIIQSNQSIY